MTRIFISAAAYHAIGSTLPVDALLWPMRRQGAANASPKAKRLSSTCLRAMRGPVRSY
jgi:hypothetical protein